MKTNLLCDTRLRSFEVAQQLKQRGLLGKFYSGAVLFGARGSASDYGLEPSDIVWHRLPTLVARAFRPFGGKRFQLAVRHRQHHAFGRWCERVMEPADVVHAWSHMALEAFQWARREGAVCVLERSAAHGSYWRDILTEEFAKWGSKYRDYGPTEEKATAEYEEADAIVVPSNFCKETIVRYGVPEGRVHVIPFGMQKVQLGQRRRPSDGFRVLYVGGLGILKGVQYLLQAAELLRGIKDMEFVLVGGKPERAIAKLMGKCSGRIVYLGYKKKRELFEEVYRTASVLVFPSLMDGFGYVVVEAAAHGVPVIVTANTGAKDVITHEREGFIVPIRDPEAIAEKIRLLYDDGVRLEEMSQAAYELGRVSGRTWDDYGEEIERMYRNTMELASSGQPVVGRPGLRDRSAPRDAN